jgi:hypothetical protein
MVDIVRVANEERTRCEEYTAIDMTVNSLAVWHSHLGLHARWVLGVRHGKESGARKLKYCSQDGGVWSSMVRGNEGGVCDKHGAIVSTTKNACCEE